MKSSIVFIFATVFILQVFPDITFGNPIATVRSCPTCCCGCNCPEPPPVISPNCPKCLFVCPPVTCPTH